MGWAIALFSGFYPIGSAWIATRGSTLRHAVAWAAAAWLAWCAVPLAPDSAVVPYLALSLTACAGAAVLGARRPGVGAWNFVVAGLLLVLLRPLLEGVGDLRLNAGHAVTLAAALIVGLGNYVPTRQGPAALLLGGFCAATLAGWHLSPGWPLAAVWLSWLLTRRYGEGVEEQWRGFRDRFGFAWAARQREQFDRAAANAGVDPDEAAALVRATLKRFESG